MSPGGVRGGEEALIRRICSIFQAPGREVLVPIGDDAAVVTIAPARRLILTTDQVVEGVHFRRTTHPPGLLGEKALSVNLSDLAAMGGEPRWALLSLLLPKSLPPDYLEAVLRGLARRARRSGTALVGGNITRAGRFALDVTLVGTLPRGVAPLLRRGAQPGDLLFVSGSLGGSALGLRLLRAGWRWSAGRARRRGATRVDTRSATAALRMHLCPEPELELGRLLARDRLASAAMDLSDGLSRDLARLCQASGVGARVELDSLPLHPAARELAGEDAAARMALHGGEDYRLLFSVPPDRLGALTRRIPPGKRRPIGQIVSARQAVTLRDRAGRIAPLPVGGFDHLLALPAEKWGRGGRRGV